MPDDRFDDLTKLVSKSTSRRGLLKGAAAVALGGIAARVRGNGGGSAEARARVSMACARLGQPCATGAGTPGNMICCPNLICGDGAVCCKDTNETCVDDGDCCADNVCRPNPTGLGNRCLPPGDVGAECLEDEDCLSGLACETTTGTCGVVCGTEVCTPDQTCDSYTLTCVVGPGAPCLVGSDCSTGFCDPYTLTCLDCIPNGSPCFLGACCSGFCFKGIICVAP
jgi:hypothetical protein